MILTKSELQNELRKRKFLALHKDANKGKNYTLAQGFLRDLKSFYMVLNKIEDSQKFHVIRPNRLHRLIKRSNILFDSFSIVLLKGEDKYYIYYTPKYQLK